MKRLKIVAFGDSLTAGVAVPKDENNWTDILAAFSVPILVKPYTASSLLTLRLKCVKIIMLYFAYMLKIRLSVSTNRRKWLTTLFICDGNILFGLKPHEERNGRIYEL